MSFLVCLPQETSFLSIPIIVSSQETHLAELTPTCNVSRLEVVGAGVYCFLNKDPKPFTVHGSLRVIFVALIGRGLTDKSGSTTSPRKCDGIFRSRLCSYGAREQKVLGNRRMAQVLRTNRSPRPSVATRPLERWKFRYVTATGCLAKSTVLQRSRCLPRRASSLGTYVDGTFIFHHCESCRCKFKGALIHEEMVNPRYRGRFCLWGGTLYAEI